MLNLKKLAPFGMDNPKPIFLLENMHLKGTKRIGADKTHLKTMLATEENDATLDSIGFGVGDLVEKNFSKCSRGRGWGIIHQ